MKRKTDEKNFLRKQIILASHVYQDWLAGNVFLYVYGNTYFEVVFRTDRFMHLTGVGSKLHATDFYNKSTHNLLTTKQFFIDSEHPYHIAKKKLACLSRLPEITRNLVCIVNEMHTLTLTYKIGITNLDFTLGLTENTDLIGNKINNYFLPRSFRVKDKAIENSKFAEFVDFIFCRDASLSQYSDLLFFTPHKVPPQTIKEFLNLDLIKRLYPQ